MFVYSKYNKINRVGYRPHSSNDFNKGKYFKLISLSSRHGSFRLAPGGIVPLMTLQTWQSNGLDSLNITQYYLSSNLKRVFSLKKVALLNPFFLIGTAKSWFADKIQSVGTVFILYYPVVLFKSFSLFRIITVELIFFSKLYLVIVSRSHLDWDIKVTFFYTLYHNNSNKYSLFSSRIM